VARSVLDAIKEGQWDFEPVEVACNDFDACDAMPGTDEKVEALAQRIMRGLPLWHASDRDDLETPPVNKPR
jgi:hypothetical protein